MTLRVVALWLLTCGSALAEPVDELLRDPPPPRVDRAKQRVAYSTVLCEAVSMAGTAVERAAARREMRRLKLTPLGCRSKQVVDAARCRADGVCDEELARLMSDASDAVWGKAEGSKAGE